MSYYYNNNMSGRNHNNNTTSVNNNNNNNNHNNNNDNDTMTTQGSIGQGGSVHTYPDDGTMNTTGDESSSILRARHNAALNAMYQSQTQKQQNQNQQKPTNNNNNNHLSIHKKDSDVSGYQFGNSSVGGNTSFSTGGGGAGGGVGLGGSGRVPPNSTRSGNGNHGGYNNNNTKDDSSASYYYNSNNTTGTNNTVGTATTMNNHPSSQHHHQQPSFCGCCSVVNLRAETLEYNYAVEARAVAAAAAAAAASNTKDGTDKTTSSYYPKPPSQPYPRIRSRGEYYIDTFNDEPWSWSMGTNEQNGTWCNSSDQAGTIMSAMVWVLMLYSAFTVTALTVTEGIPVTLGMIYALLVFMSLASHAKTSFTDPGSVPLQAIPSERQRLLRDSHSMCGQCQTFKPPGSHHCRICNRCIARMDHHCPWMNNCVGAGNLKHFILFLVYTWTCAAYSLLLFGWNYFFCSNEDCIFHPLVVHLVRLMTLLAIGAFLFTSSMLMNVCYGIMTGIGTIDRLKKKATNTMSQSDEEPIQLIDVFGIGGYWTWILPLDPIFDEHDKVMGYTIPARLDRERQFCDLVQQQLFIESQNHNQSQNQQTQQTQHSNHNNNQTMRNNQKLLEDHLIKTNQSMDYPTKCVNAFLPV